MIAKVAFVMTMVLAGTAWSETVTVTVKDPGGPVAKAFVEVGAGDNKKIGTTDGDGVAAVDEVAEGMHTVTVNAVCPDGSKVRTASRRVKVTASGGGAVTFQLEACPRTPKGTSDDD